jgi:hypothetical protein
LLIRQIAQTCFGVLEVLIAQDAKLLSLQIEQDSTVVIQKLTVILDIRIAKDEQLLILHKNRLLHTSPMRPVFLSYLHSNGQLLSTFFRLIETAHCPVFHPIHFEHFTN